MTSVAARKDRRFPAFSREIAVLYEDDAVVALDKPPGLPAVPIPRSNVPSAQSLLSEALKPQGKRAFVVHRIDRFTSGILLFAKSESDRGDLVHQFLAHTPERHYLAGVRGHLANPEGTLVHYLRRSGMFQKVSEEANPEAARAELRYRVERQFARATLVRAELVTGLQNQIRVQFAAIGHPVIGDRKYHAGEVGEERIDRVALHACHLKFRHPRTGRSISLDSEPPADFQALLRALAKG